MTVNVGGGRTVVLVDDAELWELMDDYVDEQIILERIDAVGEPWDEVMDELLEDVCLGHPASRPSAPVWVLRPGQWVRGSRAIAGRIGHKSL